MNLTFIFNKNIIFIFLVLFFSGISIFSFAPYNYYWIMPFCLIGFFTIVLKSNLNSFKISYLWGLFYFFIHNYWIKITLNEIINLNIFLSILLLVLFAGYLALYPAIAIWIATKFKINMFTKLVVFIPAFWTILEYFRGIIFTGYSWGEVGYSQIGSIFLSGFTPIGGIHLVTYILVLISSLVVYLLFFEKTLLIKILLSTIIIVVYISGNYLLKVNFTKPNGNFSKIAAVQGNIPQNLKFTYVLNSINVYLKQINLYPKVNIMIFPETAIPIILKDNNDYLINTLRVKSINQHTALIVGIIKKTIKNKLLNSAIVINPYSSHINLNKKLEYYAKNHLVPFGEYTPLYKILKKFYDTLDIPLNNILPGGKNQKPIPVANQKVAINICYEDGFGDDLINTAKNSTLLINMSNMGWYGKSNAMDLQLQQSQARALELGRMLVRATNNGKTAVISNKGKILSVLPRDVMQVLVYKVQGFTGETPFMKMGSSKILIVILSIIILLGWIINLAIINYK